MIKSGREFPKITPVKYKAPSIDIGDYTFALLSRYTTTYEIVQIESKQRDGERGAKIFWVYPSSSELGLWRCMVHVGTKSIEEGSRQVYKGDTSKPYYDYIQQTLIHLQLQEFINANKNKIPIFNDKSEPDFWKININEFSAKYLYQRESREFQEFRNITTQQEVIGVIDDRKRALMVEPFYDLRQKLKCGYINTTTPRRRTPKVIIKEFSLILDSLYEIVDDRLIYKYNNSFSQVFNTQGEIRGIYLTRRVKEDNASDDIILYYYKCKLEPFPIRMSRDLIPIVNRICDKPVHIMPFLLTTMEAETNEIINEFGMYTTYIPSGAFLCKLFDYSVSDYPQCTPEEIAVGRCTIAYSYIGSRYDDIFPFNRHGAPQPVISESAIQLPAKMSELDEATGRIKSARKRRRKIKTRKSNQKYRRP
jgi:hypothetical protein